jgi:predicted extracellular nuclease
MAERYFLVMARNTETGVKLRTQDLTGNRFTWSQRELAQARADQLAEQLTARTRETWEGYLVEYTPTVRRR